nr:MAG TPA: hypothetical protein [Caudoviricetes sp.]
MIPLAKKMSKFAHNADQICLKQHIAPLTN